MSLADVTIPKVIGNWYLGEKLGAGFSGAIYKATHLHTKQVAAIKIQHTDDDCPTNRYERGFYPSLQGGEGMPKLWMAGVQGELDYLVIDLLGPSLDNLYRKNNKQVMDLHSVCCIAIQTLSRLEFMHSRGILHRDIQLGNAVIGLPPNESTIYMIDFGFSKRYIDPHTKRHIQDNKKPRDFIGNYWFSSVNVHCKGRIPTRRDDLEAAALMFIHILTPSGLSWTRKGVPRTDDEHNRLKREKAHAKPEDLCRGMPTEFEEFLRYCRRLRFAECPDYEHWREEFRALMVEHGFGESDSFIWPAPPVELSKAPAPRRAPLGDDGVEKVLNDLANLRLDARPVLGDRTAVVNAVNQAQDEAQKTKSSAGLKKAKPAAVHNSRHSTPPTDIIVISDSDITSDDSVLPPRDKIPEGSKLPKAVQLRKVAGDVGRAGDNLAMAHVVSDFVRVLRDTNSRNLTKEGFTVLDALMKQLADPSVYVVPLRRARSRGNALENDQNGSAQPRFAKATKLVTLRRNVGAAASNKELATMVQDFGKITDASNGRTITKDGYAFLEGLATRLKEIG